METFTKTEGIYGVRSTHTHTHETTQCIGSVFSDQSIIHYEQTALHLPPRSKPADKELCCTLRDEEKKVKHSWKDLPKAHTNTRLQAVGKTHTRTENFIKANKCVMPWKKAQYKEGNLQMWLPENLLHLWCWFPNIWHIQNCFCFAVEMHKVKLQESERKQDFIAGIEILPAHSTTIHNDSLKKESLWMAWVTTMSFGVKKYIFWHSAGNKKAWCCTSTFHGFIF